jgi:hypothetical protein
MFFSLMINFQDPNLPYIRYIEGIMSGKYKGDEFFASLLQAIVMKADKEEDSSSLS